MPKKFMLRKGQAEIMDGLILMLIAAICSTVLLHISSTYGVIPTEIYEETYAQKLAQNTLLSLYHITYLDDVNSPFYKKSIMVAVSQELSSGNRNFGNVGNVAGDMLRNILQTYSQELGWHFMFAIISGDTIFDESIVSTDPSVTNSRTFKQNVGNPSCASAALTYPKGDCSTGGGGSAGNSNMCYAIFEICTWQS